MKLFGHLNRDISRVLAAMGHTDSLVIADCGLLVPPNVECIDVSLARGEPDFVRVLETVLADFAVERAVFAWETRSQNPPVDIRASALAREGIQVEFVTHERLKEMTREARAIIRTGEATPYANVILFSQVVFAHATRNEGNQQIVRPGEGAGGS
jgi:D-ribose pyranase